MTRPLDLGSSTRNPRNRLETAAGADFYEVRLGDRELRRETARAPPIPPHEMFGFRWLTRAISGRVTGTERFRKQCEEAFNEVDHNENDALDKTEIRLSVMLLYHKVNAKLKNRQISPPTREDIMALFERMDTDGSGELSLDEFHAFMEELCKHATTGAARELLANFVLAPVTAGLVKRGVLRVAPKLDEEMQSVKGLAPTAYSCAGAIIINALPPPVGKPR